MKATRATTLAAPIKRCHAQCKTRAKKRRDEGVLYARRRESQYAVSDQARERRELAADRSVDEQVHRSSYLLFLSLCQKSVFGTYTAVTTGYFSIVAPQGSLQIIQPEATMLLNKYSIN